MNVLLLSVGLFASFPSLVVSQADNVVDATNWIPFNCARPTGNICSGRGTCNGDGTCTCQAGFLGTYDCSLSFQAVGGVTPQLVSGALCTPQCQNAGTCYRPNPAVATGEFCFCPPEFRGASADCSIARASVLCREADMAILVYPQAFTSFTGRIAVQLPATTTLLDASECSAGSTISLDWDGTRFSKTFPTIAAGNLCTSALQTSTTADGTQQVCYDLRLVYSPFGILTPSDELFRYCCNEVANGNSGDVSVGDQTGNNGGSANISDSIEVIASRLEHTVSGLVVQPTDVINVGSEISYVVTFSDTAVRYEDLRVTSCTATANLQTLPLITAGCPNPNALSIVRNIRKVGKEIHVDIWAFRPTPDTVVTLTCNVQVCAVACGAQTLCSGTSILNLGRKKREASNSTGETEIIETSQTFKIYLAPETSCPVQPECGLMTEVFVPVAVVFGVLLLVVLIVAGLLCFRHNKSRNAKDTA